MHGWSTISTSRHTASPRKLMHLKKRIHFLKYFLKKKQKKEIALCNCTLSYEPHQQNNECMVRQNNIKFII